MKILYSTVLAVAIFFSCFLNGIAQERGPADLVDPFIGTGGHGHTYPGAVHPFGMVQLSPDTRLDGWDGCSAYHYTDSISYGFSHTHLSGTGIPDYADILMLPYTGQPSVYESAKFGSLFDHKTEKASPGYYKCELKDYGVEVELTASSRCGFHKYTFNKAEDPKVMIDLINKDFVVDSYIQINNEYEIQGYRFSSSWAKDQKVYFVAKFSLPIVGVVDHVLNVEVEDWKGADFNSDSIRLSLGFDLSEGDHLFMKVGISGVSIEGAKQNLQEEIPNWDFEKVKKDTHQAWNKQLSKIEVFGGTREQQEIFYTALYHTMIVPNLFNDVDGKFRGLDGQIYQDNNRNTYTVFSLWDTYRATHPLYTLIERERTIDFINTMIAHYEQSGLLPVWELAGNETNCMIGTHGVSVISDAMKKGIRGFDWEKAFEAMEASLEQDEHDLNMFRKYGYMPSDQVNSSVSKTLEFAYNYWCLAESAKILGKKDLAKEYSRKAQFYKNTFDPSTGFMRPKRNGTWLSPFDPKQVDFNYTEANSWQYSFYVPQDVNGLIDLMGGESAFEKKLDELFTTDSKTTGRHQADITGLIGQYAHGNEPSHHMAYLYNFVGKPWKTQKYVDKIMNELYTSYPNGYSGNEDCGQMSAWYVFGALGFYPVTPGSDDYIIGKPMFPRIILNFEDGKYFIIESDQYNKGDYIRSVLYNKKPYNKSYLKHEDIINGGKLAVYTGKVQSPTFGIDPDNRPVSSIDPDQFVITPVVKEDISSFKDQQSIELISLQGNDIFYRIKKEKGRFKKWEKYTLPLIVDYSGEIEFYASKNGVDSEIQTSVFSKIDHSWTIDLLHPFSPQYTGGGDDGLINGIRGGRSFSDGSWQGFHGKDFVSTVDLKEVKSISKIEIGFLQDQRSWIWFPLEVKIELSEDNINFKEVSSYQPENQERAEGTIIDMIKLKFPRSKAKYVKISAKNRGVCPSWHPGAGGKAWLFLDEIKIK